MTSLALEVAASCLTQGNDPVIGGWTTASLRQTHVLNPEPQSAKSVAERWSGCATRPTHRSRAAPGPRSRVSGRRWSTKSSLAFRTRTAGTHRAPKDDRQFADYVTNPSLPVLLQALFGGAGVRAPNVYPRTDLVAAFLTGIKGLNQPANVTAAEELRLNTSIPPTPVASQNDLGVLGGDHAGFPNGRRPIDDVVTIELRVAMGVLLAPFDGSASDPDPSSDASRQLHYTDGVEPNPADYLTVFPYVNTPLGGSPTSTHD